MNSDNVFGVILAGGSGSRLWPLSREMFPKQLLKLGSNDEETLFQQTIKLLNKIIDKNQLLAITNMKLENDLKYQFDSIFSKNKKEKVEMNVIIEPVQRNTAPAIAASTLYILNNYNNASEDSIIIVAPSDHVISDKQAFLGLLNNAVELAKDNFIVTLGIVPDKPETAYGYIKAITIDQQNLNYYKVDKFVEKPSIEKAEVYLEEGNYYWNSGIFVFKAQVILEEMKKYCPDLFDILQTINFKNKSLDFEEYSNLPEISIDYAVMEHSDKLVVLPADVGWSDLGSWNYVYESSDKDDDNNFVYGNVLNLSTKNSIVYGSDRLVATIGLDNMVVVNTEDATLICPLDRTQEVKNVYSQLKERKDSTIKYHQTQLRPWGYFTLLQVGDNFKIQSLNIKPKCHSTKQMHYHKNKHWTIVDGIAEVTKNDKIFCLKTGESIDIISTEKHQVFNPGVIDLKIIEVQTGNYFGEDDIIRFKS